MLFMLHICLCYAVLSVPCSLVVICWERADLLALFCVVFHVFLYLLFLIFFFLFTITVSDIIPKN